MRSNLGGVQKVEVQTPLRAEMLSRGRSWAWTTPFAFLVGGREAMIAITNGNNYPLMIDWFGISVRSAQLATMTGMVNPVSHNATLPITGQPLDFRDPQVFDGSALYHSGLGGLRPVGGEIWCEAVHNSQSHKRGGTPVLLAPGDVFVVAAEMVAGLSFVSATVLGHNVY